MKYKYTSYDYSKVVQPYEFTFNLPYDYIIKNMYIKNDKEMVIEMQTTNGIEKLSIELASFIESNET